MKSEYATWIDELERERLTIGERVARWFDRPAKAAEPDFYTWHDVSVLLPVNGEG